MMSITLFEASPMGCGDSSEESRKFPRVSTKPFISVLLQNTPLYKTAPQFFRFPFTIFLSNGWAAHNECEPVLQATSR
jgi:hypothetical protein